MKYISPLNSEIKGIVMLLIQLVLLIHKLTKKYKTFQPLKLREFVSFIMLKLHAIGTRQINLLLFRNTNLKVIWVKKMSKKYGS